MTGWNAESKYCGEVDDAYFFAKTLTPIYPSRCLAALEPYNYRKLKRLGLDLDILHP
jgi:hypothetical protein